MKLRSPLDYSILCFIGLSCAAVVQWGVIQIAIHYDLTVLARPPVWLNTLHYLLVTLGMAVWSVGITDDCFAPDVIPPPTRLAWLRNLRPAPRRYLSVVVMNLVFGIPFGFGAAVAIHRLVPVSP